MISAADLALTGPWLGFQSPLDGRSGRPPSGRTAGRHEDPIERRLVGPAERSAADAHPHVVVAEPLEQCARPLGQAGQPLDRADAPRQLRQHRGLIAGAGADLEDLFLTVQLEELRHEPDDVGLGDGLLFADRQRMVAVRAVLQRLLDEEMARDPAHRGEHALVGDTAARELLLDHARPSRLVRVAGPLHYPLRGFLGLSPRLGATGARPVSPRSWAVRLVDQSFSSITARWWVRSRCSGVTET